MSTAPPSPPEFYYLSNFERALAWLGARYDDLFDDAERAFLHDFAGLPRAARALLVRMLMRKGPLFRESKLAYDEIGPTREAAAALIALGWVDPAPGLTPEQLFALVTRAELMRMVPADAAPGAGARKADLLAHLHAARGDEARPFSDWQPGADERVLAVTIGPLCDRLRLLFFGNLYQDWSEFVLADLGVFQYEPVAFGPASRAFQRRADVDAYLALHACREALAVWPDDAPLDALTAAAEALTSDNPWLATRRAKLLFQVGQTCERRGEWDGALAAYLRSAWPGSRHRRVRVLERSGHEADALALAETAARAPESEEEAQRVARMLPRLRRRAGQPAAPAARAAAIPRGVLALAPPAGPFTVETAVRDHLDRADAPVHYVENTLINSLFGLLCWEPVFAALPGAFFHPFQRGPADLHAPDFRARRAAQFDACLAQLDSDAYRETIRRHYAGKAGVQSPFVFWGALDDTLLEQALACLPAAHLRLWFERLLADIRGNRSGLPDLVRFWPAERRYELIEVKAPGDRLQDNQIRWLSYCVAHEMPVRVLDVTWRDAPGADVGAEAGA